ncbi:MAG TPA: c-type cytochrome, partial [Chthoniobacterales bacterium]|nr:c-type cytochrome [Chthoniobacterales bacterium]
QPVEWDLANATGKKAYLEIVDGDTGSAYAWLAAGRFDPAVVPMPSQNPNEVSKRIQAACGLAKTMQLTRLAPKMSDLLAHDTADADAQLALATGLVALQPSDQRQALVSVLNDASVAPVLRQRIVQSIAAGPSPNSLDVLVEVMRSVPSRLQLKIAQSLASSASGADTLLSMIEKSQASPRLLLDKTLQDKFTALNSSEVKLRQAKLTRDLEPASESTQKLIEARAAAYDAHKTSSTEGARVFTQNCAICHQVGGQGAIIGPQLDGVGSRGLDRIVEDVLDPNRNVDVNFRTQVIVLKDGDVQSGLLRREEGELLILADSTGKEISIPKKDIQTRRQSDTSLMPGNFGDIIPEKDFENLMAFLLSKGAAAAGK